MNHSHIVASPIGLPDLGAANNSRGALYSSNPTPGSEEDKQSVTDLAAYLRSKIGQQMTEKTQGAKYIATLFPSASSWNVGHVIPLQVCLLPVDNLHQVVPQDCIPKDVELFNEYADLLDTNMDGFKIREKSEIAKLGATATSKFFNKLRVLVMADEPAPNMLGAEQKPEIDSDALLRDLLELCGVNQVTTIFNLGEERTYRFKMGGLEPKSFDAKIEFVVQDENKKDGKKLIVAWAENKKLLPKSTYPDTVSQKIAELLATVRHNWSTPTGAETDNQPQEIFGICIRHRYVSFWHAVIGGQHLYRLLQCPGMLGDAVTSLKCFPHSQYGLDLLDPASRLQIVRGIRGILEYYRIGNHQIGPH